MPTGALMAVLSWFAGHMIVLTLSAFAVLGFLLLSPDAVEPDRQPKSEPASRVVPSDQRVDGHRPVASTKPEAPAPRADGSAEPRARGPKLIGGSIPVYDLKDRTAPDPDGFRPGATLSEVPADPAPGRETQVQNARRAFWNGQFEVAESLYMDLIAEYPDEADIFGELGNLYEGMGQADLAKDAFFEAGVRLRAAGEQKKLAQVIEILKNAGDDRHLFLGEP